MSPTTTSTRSTSEKAPSRNTGAVGAMPARRRSAAALQRKVCTKLMVGLSETMTTMMTAFTISPTNADAALVKRRMAISGFANWSSRSTK